MSYDTAIKAIYELKRFRLRSPVRWTKKFGRFLDEVWNLCSVPGLENYFNKHIIDAANKGDTEGLIKGTKKFKKDLEKVLKKPENSEKGNILQIKGRLKETYKYAKKIEDLLEHVQKNVPEGSKEAFKETIKIIYEDWKQAFDIIGNTIEDMSKLEKDLAFNRHQLIMQNFQFDVTTKKDISFFYQRDIDLHKEEGSIMHKIEGQIAHLKNPKYIENVKDEVKKEFQEFINKLTEEMKLIQTELKETIILMIRLEHANEKTFQDIVINRLHEELGLNDPKVLDQIKKIFDSIPEKISEDSEVNYEMLKKELQDGGSKLGTIGNLFKRIMNK